MTTNSNTPKTPVIGESSAFGRGAYVLQGHDQGADQQVVKRKETK